MKNGMIATLILAGSLAWSGEVGSELLGARAVIEKALSESGQKTVEQTPAVKARMELRRDIAAFRNEATNRTPQEAAGQWMGLLDRLWSLPVDPDADPYASSSFGDWEDDGADSEETGEEQMAGRPLSFEELLRALPGPDAWPHMKEMADQRADATPGSRETALRLLFRFLDGDWAQMDESIQQLDKALRESSGRSYYGGMYGGAGDVRRVWLQVKGFTSPGDVVRQFRDALEQASRENMGPPSIVVPPLVDLTSAEESDELLRKCLLTPGLRLEMHHQGATMDRLKALAVESIDKLPAPRWELVRSVKDIALFEAMERRFPSRKEEEDPAKVENTFVRQDGVHDQYRRQAQQVYVMALLKAGRVEEAFSRSRSGDGLQENPDRFLFENLGSEQVAQAGLSEVEAERMFKAMEPFAWKNPDRFPWSLWMNLGLMAGQGDAVVKTLATVSTNTSLGVRPKITLLGSLSRACFALDRVEEGLTALRGITTVDISRLPPDQQRELMAGQRSIVLSLLRLGHLLQRADLLEEGLRLSSVKSGGSYDYMEASLGRDFRYPTVLGLLVQSGRYAEAEKRLQEALAQVFKSSTEPGGRILPQARQQTGQIMGALLAVYEKAGRDEDALWLLDESPWWPDRDLGESLVFSGEEFIPAAARVLGKAGRNGEAVRLVKAYLNAHPSDDRAYEVLVSLGDPDLSGWLDSLYMRDRFEERPLIWKAVVLRQAGRLKEAEEVCRRALKVDPTDGEQEPGQRVKAYAVLADILEAGQKTDDARFFRNVVRAVRIAEEGDEFFEAGLTARSLAKFQEAEGLFVDAYCVQWRLAERLWAAGRFEEANRHYAIAFERMPEQFGQVASFCFGCQGVFEKEQSRTVAEQVLTRLSSTQGERPQVHFLLGQLREAQYRYADAYRCFKRAVELDPDYLDAWRKLYELNQALYLPGKERDAIVFRGMELDPLRRHFGAGLESVGDMRRLWALAARHSGLSAPRGKVYELKGSAKAIAAERAAISGSRELQMRYSYRPYWGWREPEANPSALLLRHQMVQALCRILR